jgi:uncharacterized protein YlxW (UPF0749 family)
MINTHNIYDLKCSVVCIIQAAVKAQVEEKENLKRMERERKMKEDMEEERKLKQEREALQKQFDNEQQKQKQKEVNNIYTNFSSMKVTKGGMKVY